MAKKHDFEITFLEGILKRAPHYPEAINLLGTLYTLEGRLDEGLKMDRKLTKLEPDNPTAFYNLACSLALKNRKRQALKVLQTAIDLGYDDLDWLRKDKDLFCLHQEAQFKAILTQLQTNQSATQE